MKYYLLLLLLLPLASAIEDDLQGVNIQTVSQYSIYSNNYTTYNNNTYINLTVSSNSSEARYVNKTTGTYFANSTVDVIIDDIIKTIINNNSVFDTWLPNYTAKNKYWYNMSDGSYNITYANYSYNHTQYSGNISGAGYSGYLCRFSAGNIVANSVITQNGTDIHILGNLFVDINNTLVINATSTHGTHKFIIGQSNGTEVGSSSQVAIFGQGATYITVRDDANGIETGFGTNSPSATGYGGPSSWMGSITYHPFDIRANNLPRVWVSEIGNVSVNLGNASMATEKMVVNGSYAVYSDNQKYYVGAGKNGSMYFNGTCTVITGVTTGWALC